MASSSSLYFAESDPSYYLSTFEQEHCTGYNCCDIKLDDMHAVMEHYETVHQIPYLGNTRRSVPRLPAVRHQPIVTPLLPVAPIFDFDSASSPASTAYSERAASLPHEDEDHFDKGLDTAPQTPTASPTHSPFNVTIVGTHDSADGFNFNPMYQIGSPIVGTHQAFANSNTSVPKLAPAYPIMGVPQPPLLSVARPVDTPRQAPAMPSFHPHSSVLAPGLDVDSAVHNAEVESEEPSFYQQRRLQPATAVYPLQYQVPRPQVMRQSSLHAIPTAVPALTPARSHSINLPSRESSYTPRPMHESTYQRPLVPSPSPASDVLQISSSARMQAVRIRNNGSVPFPQSSAASSTVASPSIAGTKRSFDEVDASDSEDEDAQGEDDDEDAEGELEQDVSPVMQALLNRPAVTISRDAKGQGKEKRSKTGRPKGTGRSSAQKDPKRKKLECPRPGCTKRYMNPNGLKYHLEKGTCTLEA